MQVRVACRICTFLGELDHIAYRMLDLLDLLDHAQKADI